MVETNAPLVVTVVANPDIMPLSDQDANSIVDGLQNSGAIIEDVKWLSGNKAIDIYFAVLDLNEADRVMAHLLESVPFDYLVHPNRGRKKKLLISDMDSTIIEQECIDEIADYIGIKPQISKITEQAMNGEINFEGALKERVALLKDIPENTLDKAFMEKISITPGAKELVRTMKSNGAKCILVSGGFTFFTKRVQEEVGFDIEEANILEIKDGKLTGNVKEPVLDKEAKLNALKLHAEEAGVPLSMTMAVGDGANDLPMLKAAGLGIAYHAKPKVRSEVRARINSGNLTNALFFQGYEEKDFVS